MSEESEEPAHGVARRRRGLAGALFLAVLLAGAAYVVLGGPSEPPVVAASPGAAAPEPRPEDVFIGASDPFEPGDEVARPRADGEPVSTGGRAPAPTGGAFVFEGHLVDPDRRALRVPQLTAVLFDGEGNERVFEGADVQTVRIDGIERGSYEIEVSAPGYRARRQALDLSRSQLDGRGEDVLAERVVLWPDGWIPVVVVTRDGRPFRALAEDLGWEPKRLFVDAFCVGLGHEPPADGAACRPETELGVMHEVPGYQNVELPGSVACSVELRVPPPVWVGLWIHGVHHESRLLHGGDGEVRFEIDRAAVEAGLATVTLRVVEKGTDIPALDTTSTLKADTSAHRRADLTGRAPDAEGRVVFERVLPGQHELTVTREGNTVQRRIVLGTAERLDLGNVEIGSGPGLPVVVVDAEGQPVPSWVEVAPYSPGDYAERLYPPNLHRQTGDDGRYELAVPDRKSIVRVRPYILNGRYQEYPDVGSRNVLVDPEQLPAELRVLAEETVSLLFRPRTPWVSGHRITVVDDLGLVVDMASGGSDDELWTHLFPGRYVVRRWEGEREVGSLDVLVERGQKELDCP